MAFKISVTDGLAAAALLFSIYSTIRTIGFSKRQDKLNRLLIDKERQDNLIQKQADISANFVKLGSSHYRLKVFNKGKATAKNVRIEFPNGNEILMESDIADKFPVESLEPIQSVELMAAVHMESPRKMDIRFIWNDSSSDNRTKIVTTTL